MVNTHRSHDAVDVIYSPPVGGSGRRGTPSALAGRRGRRGTDGLGVEVVSTPAWLAATRWLGPTECDAVVTSGGVGCSACAGVRAHSALS